MRWSDFTKEDVLNVLGLSTRPSTSSRVLGAVGLFGLGLLAGASAALLLAPKSGAELRRELGRKLGWQEEPEPNGHAVDEVIG